LKRIFGNFRAQQKTREALIQTPLMRSLCLVGPAHIGKATFLSELLSELVPDTDLLFTESGVESAKEAVEFCKTQPLLGASRYVVVNDAHLLTEGAQDAYLKLLEEPGNHSCIIFVTSDDGLLQPAIKSRFRSIIQWISLSPEEMIDFAISLNVSESNILTLCDGKPGLFRFMIENDGSQYFELNDFLFQVLEGKKNPLTDLVPDVIKDAKDQMQRECVAHICRRSALSVSKTKTILTSKIVFLLKYSSLLISLPSANSELHWLQTATHLTL